MEMAVGELDEGDVNEVMKNLITDPAGIPLEPRDFTNMDKVTVYLLELRYKLVVRCMDLFFYDSAFSLMNSLIRVLIFVGYLVLY